MLIFYPIKVNSEEAGVGVLNVPPQYSMIKLVQQDNLIRIYLTISDYNSWQDISSASVILVDNGAKKAEFNFRQYTNETSFDSINEFSEDSIENNLLITKKCSFDHSDGDTVEEKCNLELLFVFQSTYFTSLNVIVSDRGGLTATIQLDYTSEELERSGNIIIIPAINRPFTLQIPPYLLDLIAVLIAIIGTKYILKKSVIVKKLSAIYEKT